MIGRSANEKLSSGPLQKNVLVHWPVLHLGTSLDRFEKKHDMVISFLQGNVRSTASLPCKYLYGRKNGSESL